MLFFSELAVLLSSGFQCDFAVFASASVWYRGDRTLFVQTNGLKIDKNQYFPQ
jgi:hypothetical protein